MLPSTTTRCVDLCRGRVSPLNGEQVQVVAAGGIYDGRGVAAALAGAAELRHAVAADSWVENLDLQGLGLGI